MLSVDIEKLYPAAKTLVKARAASRIHAKDAALYDFSEDAQACAADYMGWADLATNPPADLAAIRAFADEAVEAGIDTILLIGQGGSTQAPMTITKYNKHESNRVKFRTLDSDSPVRVREMLTMCDPRRTLVIISSKSGGTIEPRMLLAAVREAFEQELGDHVVRHLVAITDPGSDLERQAREEGWRAVFLGEPSVGGRFSALSVFGLVPAALQFFRGEVESGQVIGQLIHGGEGLRPVRVAGAGKAQGLDPVVRCPLAGGNHAQVDLHLSGCFGSVGYFIY